MPGSVGGDLIKAVYIVERCSGDRFRAVVSILVDRIIGLLSLLLACSIGCLFIVTRFPEFAWTVWICALGVFVGCILLLSPGLRSLLRFEMLISHLPERLGKFVAQLDDAVLQYREKSQRNRLVAPCQSTDLQLVHRQCNVDGPSPRSWITLDRLLIYCSGCNGRTGDSRSAGWLGYWRVSLWHSDC